MSGAGINFSDDAAGIGAAFTGISNAFVEGTTVGGFVWANTPQQNDDYTFNFGSNNTTTANTNTNSNTNLILLFAAALFLSLLIYYANTTSKQ